MQPSSGVLYSPSASITWRVIVTLSSFSVAMPVKYLLSGILPNCSISRGYILWVVISRLWFRGSSWKGLVYLAILRLQSVHTTPVYPETSSSLGIGLGHCEVVIRAIHTHLVPFIILTLYQSVRFWQFSSIERPQGNTGDASIVSESTCRTVQCFRAAGEK